MEQDLRKAASEAGNVNLPGDTRSLSQLMGMENLGAKSGVARLGADVLFGFNECQMKNSARITMLQLAALIQKNLNTYFVIEGHTDSVGGAAYNALLGLQRAAAVREWLVGNGVPVENVYIRSCGSSMPLAPTNGDRDAQALNRRVEIHMRAGGEELPAGCCDFKYKVDLKKKISHQLAAGVKVPETPSFRLPVGASQAERQAAEAKKAEEERKKAEQNRRKGRNGR
jgi:outer membrane protein OmpA-like peptidoglycan-associated protein